MMYSYFSIQFDSHSNNGEKELVEPLSACTRGICAACCVFMCFQSSESEPLYFCITSFSMALSRREFYGCDVKCSRSHFSLYTSQGATQGATSAAFQHLFYISSHACNMKIKRHLFKIELITKPTLFTCSKTVQI
jgi:hypothetical protein